MFSLFRKIIELLKSVDADTLIMIVDVIQKVLLVGLPPDVKDERGFRKWISDVVLVFDDLADMSSSGFDDKIVELLSKVIANDDVWGLFYGLLISLIDKDDDTDLTFTMGENDNAALLSEKTGISPAMILVIINLIVEILSWFKNKEEGQL